MVMSESLSSLTGAPVREEEEEEEEEEETAEDIALHCVKRPRTTMRPSVVETSVLLLPANRLDDVVRAARREMLTMDTLVCLLLDDGAAVRLPSLDPASLPNTSHGTTRSLGRSRLSRSLPMLPRCWYDCLVKYLSTMVSSSSRRTVVAPLLLLLPVDGIRSPVSSNS